MFIFSRTNFPIMFIYSFILFPLFLFSFNDPKFVAETLDDQVSIGYGIAIGDVDGDGKPDILLADKKQFVWYRNGDWKRFVMIDNLTEHDNVCIAARDLDGDGKVEVAVGAQWNPGETSDTEKSGSVHYLIRPEDPTQKWKAVALPHEPTVHRMRWAKAGDDNFHLIVLPLHGRGNKGGEGQGVRVIAYEFPENPNDNWNQKVIDESMHLTHNLDIVELNDGEGESILIGGKEGVKVLSFVNNNWIPGKKSEWLVSGKGIGEVKLGKSKEHAVLAAIEPLHGNVLTVYEPDSPPILTSELNRTALDSTLNQGHGLGFGDFMGMGSDQLVAGWREPNEEGEMGIKIFVPQDGSFSEFSEYWIDKDGMACEDLQVADLDGDGKPEIIASGRSTGNLKIYWNKN
jgi:hypothetical protein